MQVTRLPEPTHCKIPNYGGDCSPTHDPMRGYCASFDCRPLMRGLAMPVCPSCSRRHDVPQLKDSSELLGMHVTAVGHSEGCSKKWTDGSVVDAMGEWFIFTVCTLPGDCGSPVLDMDI
jgi:hypothetical protein